MTLLVGRLEGHLARKKLGVGLLVVTFDWSFERLIAAVVITTSVNKATKQGLVFVLYLSMFFNCVGIY